MLDKVSKIFKRSLSFVFGVVVTLLLLPVINSLNGFFLVQGFEIQSMASYPNGHMARLYTKPGLGDQTFTLEVDGRIAWGSGDQQAGDLHEKLIWDETGDVVSVELDGKKIVSYNAFWKIKTFEK